MPKASLHYLTNRFANCGFREDCELLGEWWVAGGEERGEPGCRKRLPTAPVKRNHGSESDG